MLTARKIEQIKKETFQYWSEEVGKTFFMDLAKGKEIGHKLADLVDEKTCALLTVNHITTHQRGLKGDKRSRSMGDLWLRDEGIYHPINVKTGVVGSEGQPNLVSMKKVLSGLVNRQIDSYYLLVVKVGIGSDGTIVPSVYFFDMLDWLEFVTFDSGPGQLMMKAKAFFRAYDPMKVQTRTVPEKVKTLLALYEDGEKRLQVNRAKDLAKYRAAVTSFLETENWTVTPLTQVPLGLV